MPLESSKLKALAKRIQTRIGPAREALVVLLLALLSLVVHGYYRVPGLGESDAARFARIAFGWHVRHKLSFDDVGYQIRTSALYIQLERLALDRGLPLHSLPSLVNWVSVVLGTACSVALYVLFRRLSPRPIAAAATAIYTLTPGFWLGNIYGMPTVPGLFFFLLAVILFLDASRLDQHDLGFFSRLLLAWFLMSLALTLKSDLVLCGGAFLGAGLAQPKRRWRLVCYAVGIVLGATAASIGYGHLIFAPSTVAANAPGGLLAFLKSWNDSFAVSLDALFTDSNNTPISRCVGGLLFSVIVLALIYGLAIGGVLRKQALLALLWALPPIIAWGVRFGNSARHNVPAFPPLVLFATIFLFEIVKQDVRRAALLVAGVMLASYFSNTSGEHALRPQSNLIELSKTMAKYASSMHERARALAQTEGLKRVVIAGFADPYTEFEVYCDAKHPSVKVGDIWVVTDGERTTVIDYSVYLDGKPLRQLVRNYQKDGFEALSLSYHL